MARVFVDSNVFLSLLQDEFGGNYEHMSYRTTEFLNHVIECHHSIVLSDLVVAEVCKVACITPQQFGEYLEAYRPKVTLVEMTQEDVAYAGTLGTENRADMCLLATAARTADIFCTWNVRHFAKHRNLPVRTPAYL